MNMTRVGCMPCINASKEEVEISRACRSIERISGWGKKGVGVQQAWVLDLLPEFDKGPLAEQLHGFSRSKIETIVEWSRTIAAASSSIFLRLAGKPGCVRVGLWGDG